MGFLHLAVTVLQKKTHGAMQNAITPLGDRGRMTPRGDAITGRLHAHKTHLPVFDKGVEQAHGIGPPTDAGHQHIGQTAERFTALQLVSELEGIIPALETAHAFAWLETLCPTLPDGAEVVLNCSGRGDKDVNTVADKLGTALGG